MSNGGSLVTIKTYQIQQFLMDSLQMLNWESDSGEVWIGAHDQNIEGYWQWIDGNVD